MKTVLTLILITTINISAINSAVYEALKDDSLEKVDQALASLDQDNPNSSTNAYTGALYMKKAGLISGLGKKLNIFKEGHALLETEIEAYPKNIEYRFLRLTIQEHAPKILGYNEQIEEDKNLIVSSYIELSSELKTHIRDYASKSDILSMGDLGE